MTGVQILLDEHVGRVFELRERGHPVEQAKDRFSEHTSDAELLTQSYREHSEPLDATTPSTSR